MRRSRGQLSGKYPPKPLMIRIILRNAENNVTLLTRGRGGIQPPVRITVQQISSSGECEWIEVVRAACLVVPRRVVYESCSRKVGI